MNKGGLSRKNLIDFGFICIFTISIIFMFGFTIAYSTVYGGNNTLSKSVVNYTQVWGITAGVVNEDMGHVFNISINNSVVADNWNITSVNITLWGNFIYNANLYGVSTGSNGSGNRTSVDAGGDVFFNMTNVSGIQTLSWNTTGATTPLMWGNSTSTMYFWFNATAPSPGKYNITVRVTYNQTTGTPTGNYNETNITVWVNDTTAPENVSFSGVNGLNRSIDALTNVGNYSGNLVLNVSTADNGNVRSVFFNISYFNHTTNGTVWTFKATNATTSERYWNYTLNTHNLPDGFYNLTVWVNDTNGNLNHSISLNLTIDNTPPTGTMTCTPSDDVYIGQTVSCSCSSTDVLTGISGSNSYTASPSTTTAGTITQTCTFSDRAGNNASATDTYTIWGATSSGGSSGGSSMITTASTVSSFAQITPTTPVTATNFASGSGVKQIEIEVSSTASNVQITAQKYDTTPTAVSTPKTSAYKYLKVDTQNLADKLSKATMTIQVEKTWVSGQGISKEDVALFKYNNASSQWNELTTIYSSENATYYYYTVDLTSFSYFAIAPKTVLTGEETSTGEEQPSGEQPTSATTGLLNLPYWVWTIIGIVVLAIIVGVIVLKKKR